MNNFGKTSILDVWLGSEHASEIKSNDNQKSSDRKLKYQKLLTVS